MEITILNTKINSGESMKFWKLLSSILQKCRAEDKDRTSHMEIGEQARSSNTYKFKQKYIE